MHHLAIGLLRRTENRLSSAQLVSDRVIIRAYRKSRIRWRNMTKDVASILYTPHESEEIQR